MTKRTFKTVLGLSFKDWQGVERESWQMVCMERGSAFATLDLVAGKVDRFLFADSVANEAEAWKNGLLRKGSMCA